MILFNFNAMGKLCRLHLLLLALLLPGVSFAQNLLKVQGCVTDEQNEPLIGATVQTKDKSKGTITDSGGNYVLSGVPKGSTLVFSYVGYKSKEAKATSTSLNVVLESDDEMLDEVVVIGYGQQRKVTLTGSVSNVGGKELLKSPAASLGNTLSGKLPGLQSVQYTGVPGADDPVIRIRGVGSFNSAEPLVLVDGVEREFSQIDPNEVQDISILKDASGTAVFGVRGANGVILVTTRRGEMGKPTITLTTSVGLQQISKFLEPANSYEYATAYNHAQEVEGVAEDGWKFSKEAIQHWKDMDMPTVYPSTNWFKYLMNDHAWQEQYNINVSGGTERARYFVSVGMLNQDGLFKTFDQGDDANFKYRRYNFRANLDVDFSKLSTLSIGIGGRIGRRNSIGNGEYNGQSGVFGVEGLLNNGTPMSGYGLDSEGRRIISDPNLVGAVGSDGLGLIYEQGYTTQRQSVVNLDLQYKLKLDFITKGLDFRIKGSYNSDYTQQKARTTGGGISYKATIAKGEYEENGSPKIVYVRQGDSWPLGYEESKWGGRNWYAEASLNYTRKFGDHKFGALVLYNESKNYYPGGVYNSIPRGYVGMVGRITYDYQTKYMVDLNMGYNGSENFAKGKRFGFFPSYSIGWRVSEEPFIKNTIGHILTNLKVRYSYGIVGSDRGAARFNYIQTYNTGGNISLGYKQKNNYGPLYKEGAVADPEATWEKAEKQNLGFEMSLFDKLSVTLDLFKEKRKDILMQRNTVPIWFGVGIPSQNIGQTKNRGMELELDWHDKIGENFNYRIKGFMSLSQNRIVFRDDPRNKPEYQKNAGKPIGWQSCYHVWGNYQSLDDVFNYATPETSAIQHLATAGDFMYIDYNADGVIDSKDQMPIDKVQYPTKTFGITLGGSYKNFDLNIVFYGATGMNANIPQLGFWDLLNANEGIYLATKEVNNTWKPGMTGVNRPILHFESQISGYNRRANTYTRRDYGYLRLKSLEFSYALPVEWIKAIGCQRVQLYVSGNNLFTITKLPKQMDPESSSAGVYPMVRRYNVGFRVNL